MRGLYIVVESVDGGGKGTIVRGFQQYHEEQGETVFRMDSQGWSAEAGQSIIQEIYGTVNRIPRYEVLKEILAKKGIFPEAYIVCEPTFGELGKHIREVLIDKQFHHQYSPDVRIHAYAEDRHTLLERFILPALEDGKNIYSERNVVSSLVYQSIEIQGSFAAIAKVPGNAFALRNLPKFTIISAIAVSKAMRNLALRKKEDNCFFEEPDFQTKCLNKYLSSQLKEFLEYHGTNVIYFEISEDSSPEQTTDKAKIMLADFLSQKKLNDF